LEGLTYTFFEVTIMKIYRFSRNIQEFSHLSGASISYVIEPTFIKILSVDVPSSVRRQGIGRELLRKVLELARSSNMRVILDPDSSEPDTFNNDDLIAFYKSEGFALQPDGSMIH